MLNLATNCTSIMDFYTRKMWLMLAALLTGVFAQAGCLNFDYPFFLEKDKNDFIYNNSNIELDAIQVTPDAIGASLQNMSGRIWYKRPFGLWSHRNKGHSWFNTTFVLRISPQTNPGGEGLAFILTADTTRPDKSEGKWLGIVNAITNGSPQAKIVAVEFDTSRSYSEDVDDNHVGVNVNSIYSIKQEPLRSRVNLSSATDIMASICYDGKNLSVFVSEANDTGDSMKNPIISLPLKLSEILPKKVFVGFSASTGVNTELNCVRSWKFHGSDADEDPNLLWVWITVTGVVIVLLCGFFAFYLCWVRKCKRESVEAYPTIEEEIRGSNLAPKKFKLKELRKATEKFHSKNKLGKGGFGTVYKGFLKNKEIAVKRISENSRQGKQEFIAEVTTIGSLRHRNLVKLIGWCYESREFLLVYEFMPNGSLDKLIFCDDEKPSMEVSTLSWDRRHSVICGVAQALDYLHDGSEKRVLHRDIKASNIMLDSEFNARLGDFGLARTIQQSEKTHHSTKGIAGTPGYMAPESFHTGRATVETDVYALGVLMLEVVCGRKPGYQHELNNFNNSIVDGVWEFYRSDRILDVVDSRLNGVFEEEEVECVLLLGLACCHPNPFERPSTKTVLQVLTGEAAQPLVPAEMPVFMWPASQPPSFFRQDLDCSLSGGQITPFSDLSGR